MATKDSRIPDPDFNLSRRHSAPGTRHLALCTYLALLTSLAAAQTDQLRYEVDPDFFHLPDGWNFGPTPGAARTPDGNILIFTRGPHALLEFDEDGTFVRELAHGQFETPHGLRVDSEGNIWTTDIGQHLVIKFDSDGRKQMVLGIRGNAGREIDTLGLRAELFDKPTDVAFDRDGNVYVSDGYGNSRVVKYTSDGQYVKEWGEFGSEPGQFNLPHTIHVDSDDRVWVGDRNNKRIQIFDTAGNLLKVWDHVGHPWGFAAASDGNVWMADGTANRVVKLNLHGEILDSFGEPGRITSKLGWVHYLTELRDGSLIVAEIVSHRASRYAKPETDLPKPGSGKYVFAWSGDDQGGDSDFLAVVDSDPTSDRYGEVLTTLPVGVSETMPHHTEHRMPEGDTLFANDFSAGKTYLFDLSDPLNPEIAGSFEQAREFTYPHSFERLPNGNVLSTFQTVGDGNQQVGGLVELDPTGAFVRGASAADPDVEFIRPYSLAILPELDRVVTTSTDMKSPAESWHVQIWRLSDLSLIKTIPLIHGGRGDEGLYPGEPRVTENGTVLVTTFRCGVYRIDGVGGDDPTAELIHTYEYVDGYECALATAIGDFIVQTVPAIGGLVSIDFSDPMTPREADRIGFGPGMHPHWIASSSDGRRIVVSGYRALAGRLLIVDFDPVSGRMALDERFRDKDSIFPGVSFRRDHWPHGTTRDAIPHGVVFSRE